MWALSRTLRGIFPLAAYEEMGFSKGEIDEIKQLRRERAAGGDETAFRKLFRRDLHGVAGAESAAGRAAEGARGAGARVARHLAGRRGLRTATGAHAA